MKYSLLMVLTIFILSSCKDDDVPPEIDDVVVTCKLISISDSSEWGKDEISLNYNDAGQLATYTDDFETLRFEYEGQQLNRLLTEDVVVDFTYNGSGLIPDKGIATEDGETSVELRFTHSSGKITGVDFYFLNNDETQLLLYYRTLYSYNADGSLAIVEYYELNDDETALELSYTYTNIETDGKKSPYDDIALQIYSAIAEDELLLGSDNVTRAIYTDAEDQSTEVYTNQITYNEYDYPLLMERTDLGDRAVTKLEYQCN